MWLIWNSVETNTWYDKPFSLIWIKFFCLLDNAIYIIKQNFPVGKDFFPHCIFNNVSSLENETWKVNFSIECTFLIFLLYVINTVTTCLNVCIVIGKIFNTCVSVSNGKFFCSPRLSAGLRVLHPIAPCPPYLALQDPHDCETSYQNA